MSRLIEGCRAIRTASLVTAGRIYDADGGVANAWHQRQQWRHADRYRSWINEH